MPGKKDRKHGRNKRRPGHARRLLRRPDLDRKARNVFRSGGEKALNAWRHHRITVRRDEVAKVERACKRALRGAA